MEDRSNQGLLKVLTWWGWDGEEGWLKSAGCGAGKNRLSTLQTQAPPTPTPQQGLQLSSPSSPPTASLQAALFSSVPSFWASPQGLTGLVYNVSESAGERYASASTPPWILWPLTTSTSAWVLWPHATTSSSSLACRESNPQGL